jgi:hypothetical protein
MSAFECLTDEMPKIRMSDETMLILRRKAAAAHMNLTEYVRMRLDIFAFGEDHIANLCADRARRVVRMGGES